MLLSNITIGADPELFIINSKTGKVVSSIGLIPGTKGNAYVDDTMPKGFGVEIDNILAEFNIPPVTTKEGFINNILYMQDWIRSFVKNINPDYDIKCSASEMVDADQLQSEEANLFGCDPDFNCYTKTKNPKPKPPKNLRSAGFHIHFGYANFDVETSLKIVRLFDSIVYSGMTFDLKSNDHIRNRLVENPNKVSTVLYSHHAGPKGKCIHESEINTLDRNAIEASFKNRVGIYKSILSEYESLRSRPR